MTDYVVIGPERMLRDASYDPPEPPEWGRDVCFVANAPTANAAKWAASRLWDWHDSWRSLPKENRADGKHPLAGVTVQVAEEGDRDGAWGPYFADMSMAEVTG